MPRAKYFIQKSFLVMGQVVNKADNADFKKEQLRTCWGWVIVEKLEQSALSQFFSFSWNNMICSNNMKPLFPLPTIMKTFHNS